MLATVLLCAGTMVAQAFSVTAGLTSLTIHPGDSNVAIPVTVGYGSGYAGAVTVTLAGLPSGMTVTPVTLTPGSSGVITLSASVAADQESFSSASVPVPNTATSTVTVLAFAGSMQATTPLALTVSLTNPGYVPAKINLPIVRIDTGGAGITSKTTSVPGTITITSADGSTTYLPNASDIDDTATFHVHGNSTALMPKLPYAVKLTTSVDLLTQMGLSCPYVTSAGKAVCDKSKSYVLLANYDDKTMLRDWSASALANAIPYGGDFLSPTPVPTPYKGAIPTPSGTKTQVPWASHSLFVELFVDGTYEGTYQLIEEVKVDTHRVNITELTQSQVSGDLSGGYLLEIDQRQDETYVFKTPQGLPVGLIDPDFSPSPDVPEQTSYINNYVDAAESALFSTSFQDPKTGWRAYFDQASAVNYYLVNDLMGNVDGGDFFSSVYLYKAADNPFLYMGPVWDFDISSGNVNYAAIFDPTVPWTTTQAVWYTQWFKDPGFKSAAQQQWNAMKKNGVLSSWVASISRQAAALSQAQANNFGRWPMQGMLVWPNPQAGGSYASEVNYLLNWISLRTGYLDTFLNGTPASRTTLASAQSSVYAGNTVTLAAKVSGTNPTGVVTFTFNSIVLGQAALDGNGGATLTTAGIPAGTWQLGATYNGDANNAISGAAAVPLTVLAPLVQTSTDFYLPKDSIAYDSPGTLTASVVATSGAGTPTGTITFLANGTPLGSAALSSGGIATLTSPSLSGSQVSFQARYSGDTTYAASTSGPVVAVVSTDFSLTAQGQAVGDLTQNSSTSFTFALAPLGGVYPGDVSLSATGIPSGVSYTLSTTTVNATAGAQQVTLTLHTTAQTAQAIPAGETFLLCGLLLLPFSCVRRRGIKAGLLTLLLGLATGVALMGTQGCGSPQTLSQSNVVVTATAGLIQHSATVKVQTH